MDMQNNKDKNVPINEKQTPWDFIPVNPERSQNEVEGMLPKNILESLHIMKIVEAKHHSSKATQYFLSGYEVKVIDGAFEHNAKKYSKLEFLKFIQESRFSGQTFQEVLRKVIVAWDNHSF